MDAKKVVKKDAKKPEDKTIVQKKYTIVFQSYPDGTSMITRKDMPSLIDKTEKSVRWVMDHGFKETEVEIIGEKPASLFSASASEPMPEPVTIIPETKTESA
jgi:hypothetical protein